MTNVSNLTNAQEPEACTVHTGMSISLRPFVSMTRKGALL